MSVEDVECATAFSEFGNVLGDGSPNKVGDPSPRRIIDQRIEPTALDRTIVSAAMVDYPHASK
jgi:hypothetical protein